MDLVDDPDAWFELWVGSHCTRLGQSEQGTYASVLRANRDVLVRDWNCSLDDLAEVTHRMVTSGRVPKWPQEQLPAVLAELRTLRAELAAEARAEPPGEPDAPSCDACGGVGWLVVPHPGCVWQGRVVAPRGTRGVRTTAVTCGRCAKGLAEQEAERRRDANDGRRVKLGRRLDQKEYMRLAGGHDGDELYRRHLAEKSSLARAGRPKGDGLWEMFPGLLERAAGASSSPNS